MWHQSCVCRTCSIALVNESNQKPGSNYVLFSVACEQGELVSRGVNYWSSRSGILLWDVPDSGGMVVSLDKPGTQLVPVPRGSSAPEGPPGKSALLGN